MLRFAANRGALLLVVRACFDLTKQMLRETMREGKKRGSVSSSGAPAKRPHAKRALAENGDLRGHEELGLHIRSPKKLIFAVDTHMEMTRFLRRFDWRAQFFRATPRCGDPLSPQLAYSDPPPFPFISVRSHAARAEKRLSNPRQALAARPVALCSCLGSTAQLLAAPALRLPVHAISGRPDSIRGLRLLGKYVVVAQN